MNILVIGCGNVGAELASMLDERGHDVSVVDDDEKSFDRLSAEFSGITTVGVPIDQEVLRRAGIAACDVLCAVTTDENMNLMAAQLSTEVYKVPKVIARVIDVHKGEIFESFGVWTICSTKLTVNAVCSAIEEETQENVTINFGNFSVRFTTMDVPREYIGEMPSDILYEEGETLFAVISKNSGLMLYNGQNVTFEEGDKLVFANKG